DPQQHIDAVPGPLSDLRGVDTAVQPRGQASVPQVRGSPGQRRSLLGGGEGTLAGPDPGTPVSDGGQLTAPDTVEQAAVLGRAELGQVLRPGVGGLLEQRYPGL